MSSLPPELTLLLDTLKQQAGDNQRQTQQCQQHLESHRVYTQTQVDQIRAQIVSASEQFQQKVDQYAEREKHYVAQEVTLVRQQVATELGHVNNDIQELKGLLRELSQKTDQANEQTTKSIRAVETKVIENQTENYKKVIYVQWSILFFLFTTGIGILVAVFIHH